MSYVIECEHISKTFDTPTGEFQVIKDISIQAMQNEILVLFGPGQCGKTTLLKTIAGIEPATSGTVRIHGREKTKPGPECGLVYQTTALFPWLTTMGNVEYGPKVRGVAKRNGGNGRSTTSTWWA